MEKNELRSLFKSIRKNIINKEEKSMLIYNSIIKLPIYQKSKTIALYYNLPEEVGTKKLIKKSLLLNKEVYLPVVLDNHNMEFYQIHSIDEVINKNIYGIYEPPQTKKLSINNLDLIIIPGICFDCHLNRLGFGKGYYDTFLLKNNIYKIGICFEEQVLKKYYIPSDNHDVKMDLIITDKKYYK